MNKLFLNLAVILSLVACKDSITESEQKEIPPGVHQDILSLISQVSFSGHKFKNLIEPTNEIKSIGICDVNLIYSQQGIRVQCSKKGLFIANKAAKAKVSSYRDITYIRYSGQTDYRWTTDEVYCTLTVIEADDIFELYCVSRAYEDGE